MCGTVIGAKMVPTIWRYKGIFENLMKVVDSIPRKMHRHTNIQLQFKVLMDLAEIQLWTSQHPPRV